MRRIIMWQLIIAVAALMSASEVVSDQDLSCGDVFRSFTECMGFVEGIFRRPSPECCTAVRRLNKAAKTERVPGTKGDVERVCECIEIMGRAKHLPFLATAIAHLPSMCSLRLSFPISVAMDCSQFRNKKASYPN